MEEKESIMVTELTKLSNAIDILRGIVPANSPVIDNEGYSEIMKQLCYYRDDLMDRIKINEV